MMAHAQLRVHQFTGFPARLIDIRHWVIRHQRKSSILGVGNRRNTDAVVSQFPNFALEFPGIPAPLAGNPETLCTLFEPVFIFSLIGIRPANLRSG